MNGHHRHGQRGSLSLEQLLLSTAASALLVLMWFGFYQSFGTYLSHFNDPQNAGTEEP